MISLLNQLLFDVKQRCSHVRAELERLTSVVPADVEEYREAMAQRIARAERLVDGLLSDPDIRRPELAVNYFRDYKRLTELVQATEDFPALVLGRFSNRDLWMTRFVAHICDEIGYPYQPPVCSSLSSQYYWAVPNMDLVFVPCLEPFHLLALPDLYHELGHIILFRDKHRFVYPGFDLVDRHFNNLVNQAQQQNWPSGSIDNLNEQCSRWKLSWYLEFAADLLATFCIGPAFAWSNIRLCTNLGVSLFKDAESHPADNTRANVIHLMLEHLGFNGTAEEVQKRWVELVDLSGEDRPQEYDLSYPDSLVHDIVNFVYEKCKEKGLRAYETQTKNPLNLGTMLNAAWTEFHSRPHSFADFEKEQIQVITEVLGVTL